MEMALIFLWHNITPRTLLVLAVLIGTFSVCMRNMSIEMLNLKGVKRGRSTFYGNCIGFSTAFFTVPLSLTMALPSNS